MGRTHTGDTADTGEHPKQSPGSRALNAMEQAARRAREATRAVEEDHPTPDRDVFVAEDATGVVPETPPATKGAPPTRPKVPIDPASVARPVEVARPVVRDDPPVRRPSTVWREASDPPVSYAPRAVPQPLSHLLGPSMSNPALTPGRVHDRRQRQLLKLVGVVGSLVVIGLIAIVVSATAPSGSTKAPAHLGAEHLVGGAKASKPSQSGGQQGVKTLPNISTPSTLPSTPGAAPVISSISPASGGAGQTVTVSGANFVSRSGQIVAKFDGQVAPTSCPVMSTCTVTVPTLPAGTSGRVNFTLTTDSGTSNSEDFSYQ